MSPRNQNEAGVEAWPSVVPKQRWVGLRRDAPGVEAFQSLSQFNIAQQSELFASLPVHERATLGRLLKRGIKTELDLFIRTHGANPIFDPQAEIETPIQVARAERITRKGSVDEEAVQSLIKGEVVHVLFQAGEATRFEEGPFYQLNPSRVVRDRGDRPDLTAVLSEIEKKAARLPSEVAEFLLNGALGPKQSMMLRASLRNLVANEVQSGRVSVKEAPNLYREILSSQKVLYFVSRHGDIGESHDRTLREEFKFYGFNPENLITVEQELVPGIRLDEEGNIFLMEEPWAQDAAGHLYALVQAARTGNFTTYTESGRPIRPMEMDAFGYLSSRGGRYLNVIRINDMDRHTTSIVNLEAFGYALSLFKKGYVNVIEGVSNPTGQKGGTGLTFGDPDIHILTETHENTFPSLSRKLESAMKEYQEVHEGHHPPYNAMRQWASLAATRQAVREFGGRIVYVPRHKMVNGESVWYIGVDMPMGDLSLLGPSYKSRIFQFVESDGKERSILDMKQIENLDLYLNALQQQIESPSVIATCRELILGEKTSFPK